MPKSEDLRAEILITRYTKSNHSQRIRIPQKLACRELFCGYDPNLRGPGMHRLERHQNFRRMMAGDAPAVWCHFQQPCMRNTKIFDDNHRGYRKQYIQIAHYSISLTRHRSQFCITTNKLVFDWCPLPLSRILLYHKRSLLELRIMDRPG